MRGIPSSVTDIRKKVFTEGMADAALAASDEAIMSSLKAPVRIVSGKDWPTPFSRDLEEILCPQVDEVASLVSSI